MRRILLLIFWQFSLLAGGRLLADVVTLNDGLQISGLVESGNIQENHQENHQPLLIKFPTRTMRIRTAIAVLTPQRSVGSQKSFHFAELPGN